MPTLLSKLWGTILQYATQDLYVDKVVTMWEDYISGGLATSMSVSVDPFPWLVVMVGMIATTELFGGLLCAVWMDWMCLSVGILVGWFGLVSVSVAPPYVWKRFVPHVIDMVRLFCEEVSACDGRAVFSSSKRL